MLSNFLRINLPYGIKKNSAGEWFTFNRDSMPLGWNVVKSSTTFADKSIYPIYTEYKGLTDKAILKIITNPYRIEKNEKGEIVCVYFYDDGIFSLKPSAYLDEYFEILKAFSKFSKAENRV